jgi:diaminopimelate epimerase
VRFVKGHGTENDFVVVPPGELDSLDADLARALCDRHAGIGGDGVLRVAPDPDGGWFMDYRNADGSVAETCGNGIRVFARYLVAEGLAGAGRLDIGTRAGRRRVEVPADGADITVDMGPASRLPDAQVGVGDRSWKALGYSMGNPHLVVLDAGPIDDLDLDRVPSVDPATAYPHGVNVELTEPAGARRLRMRVRERGVGETRSCGTGACAAAVAAMDASGETGAYTVDVPGGSLVVRRESGTVLMSGPALLVASGEVDLAALTRGAAPTIHSRRPATDATMAAHDR